MAKVLIVDDLEDNRQLLSFDLEDDEHEVVSACNGKECLRLAETEAPDIILLDMMMPGLSGVETLEQLKTTARLKKIPVIMVSANDTDDAVIDALDLGAHDYVTKPFIYPILAARMRSALRLKESQDALQKANINLAFLASTDPLTGCYNRRHFFELASVEFSKAERYDRDLSVLMIDADHFKAINDQYGHAAGDEALKRLAYHCQSLVRQSDLCARLGGEEFAICCPDTDIKGGLMLAERMRKAIAEDTIEHNGYKINLTVSIGVCAQQSCDQNLDEILNRADQKLYKAKQEGRNCIIN